MNLLTRLRRERGLTYILVSHDLAVVDHMCERLVVMQQGEAVETLDAAALEAHDVTTAYARTLLEASEGYKRGSASSQGAFARTRGRA